jgi:hypothetical protein
MAGLVYTRRFLRDGVVAMRRGCWARARTIYFFHVAAYFSVFIFFIVHRTWTGHQFPNAPDPMVIHPLGALVVGPLLLSQPSMLDILPFYCAFMLLCPFLIRAYETGHRRQVLALSFLTWAAGNLFSPQAPLLNTTTLNSGAFNIFAWQILFVAGTAFGHAWARGQRLIASTRPYMFVSIFAVAALLFATRHAWISTSLPTETLSWLTNKNNLAPLRLFNTCLVFWLLHAVVARFPRALSWRPFALLGRESLAVFSIHILVAYVIMAYPHFFDASPVTRSLSLVALLGAMIVTAMAASRWREAHAVAPEKPSTESGLASAKASPRPTHWRPAAGWHNQSVALPRRASTQTAIGRSL